MSSKLLYSLSDENKNLQKHIGCMNGFFQLFDRQHFLFTRRIKNDAVKRLPSGQTCNRGTETYNEFRSIIEDSHENVREKQRNSTESSRTSVSTFSWTSSFSSLECNRTNQLEQPLYSPANIPETRSQDMLVNQPKPSHSRRHSFDLQDVVRDNIHKGPQGLSVKTATKEKVVNHKFKHADSPRPVQLLDSPKPKASSVSGSPQVLAKLGEAPCCFIENRSGSLPLKDAHRLSYDGRELRDSSKSSMKLKELPRLSLDSRRGSIRESHSTIRPSNSLADLQRGRGIQNNNHIYQNELESYRGPSSVVAKLMGLEPFPTVAPSTESQTVPYTNFQEHEPFSKFSKSVNEKGMNNTPKTSTKEISPKFQNSGSVVKSHRTSKIPIEPAPWRQQSESKGPCTPTLKDPESPKNSNSFPSVYGEIEKRLAELEFRKSGRDLRALRQILEAMQKTKERLESRKESYTSDPVSQTSNKSSVNQNFDLESPRSMQCDSRISATVKGVCPPKNLKSPILMTRPSEHVERNCSASSRSLTNGPSRLKRLWASDSVNSRRELVGKQTKDMNQRKIHIDSSAWSPPCKDRNTEAFTQSKVPQHTEPDSYTSSSRSSGSVSPRPRQTKPALEKHSHSTIASTDSTTPRSIRQCSKQSTEPGSPRRKLKPKILSLQQNSVHTKVRNNMRDKGDQGSMSSQQFSSTPISASHIEAKATSADGSNKVAYSLFKPAGDIRTNLVDMLREEKLVEGPVTATLEQPSPISVLDAEFYREEPLSPIKKISSTFRDGQPMDSDETEPNMSYLNHATEISRNVDHSSHTTEINHNNIQNLQNLVRNIRQTNLTRETPTLLFEVMNPNHIYILEVLSASGLLTGADSDVSAVQLHPSGYLLDPKLFVQLEKTKAGTWSSDMHKEYKCSNYDEKIQRQLTFDAVNEVLLHKFIVEGSLKPPQGSSNRLAKRKLTKDQLFRDICSKIDHLKINPCCIDDGEDYLKGIMLQDLKYESMSWTDREQELSGVVLDVERLIFKDLINEVVSDDISCLNISAGRNRRQLFRYEIW